VLVEDVTVVLEVVVLLVGVVVVVVLLDIENCWLLEKVP